MTGVTAPCRHGVTDRDAPRSSVTLRRNASVTLRRNASVTGRRNASVTLRDVAAGVGSVKGRQVRAARETVGDQFSPGFASRRGADVMASGDVGPLDPRHPAYQGHAVLRDRTAQ